MSIETARPHTCRNCGQIGHLCKYCPHPVMSFGLICYRAHPVNGIQYLMIQRKDSLSFMEFIRGKYELYQIDYIKRLLAAMTQSERTMLLGLGFEELWNHVWYQNCIPKQTHEFLESRKNFEKLAEGYLYNGEWIQLSSLISGAPSPYTEPEWGFPKGRRHLKEPDQDCAQREFSEESGIPKEEIAMDQIIPFEEIFFGTNDVLYRHVYYVAHMQNPSYDPVLKIDPDNINQAREVRDIRWFSYQETLEKIREYNHERRELFNKVNEKIIAINR